MPGWQPPPWTVRIRLRSESSNHRPRLRGRSFFSNFGQCLFAPGPGVNSLGDHSRCPGLGLPLACAQRNDSALTQQPALQPPNQVYVQTLDGVVYLTGQVATDLQRDTAESVAHEASGVSRVMNTIALTYAGR